jgi:hypothetical protein
MLRFTVYVHTPTFGWFPLTVYVHKPTFGWFPLTVYVHKPTFGWFDRAFCLRPEPSDGSHAVVGHYEPSNGWFRKTAGDTTQEKKGSWRPSGKALKGKRLERRESRRAEEHTRRRLVPAAIRVTCPGRIYRRSARPPIGLPWRRNFSFRLMVPARTRFASPHPQRCQVKLDSIKWLRQNNLALLTPLPDRYRHPNATPGNE